MHLFKGLCLFERSEFIWAPYILTTPVWHSVNGLQSDSFTSSAPAGDADIWTPGFELWRLLVLKSFNLKRAELWTSRRRTSLRPKDQKIFKVQQRPSDDVIKHPGFPKLCSLSSNQTHRASLLFHLLIWLLYIPLSSPGVYQMFTSWWNKTKTLRRSRREHLVSICMF